jgi:ADP-ribose pyrophosphatase YjhB (NUDIX family)
MAKRASDLNMDDFLKKGDEYYLSHLSIDCVIFGFHNNELKVLLLQWKETNRWCLPGGFILKDEHIDDAAIRILNDRTGLEKIYLKQFYAFGDPSRDRKKHGFKLPKEATKSWLWERFVTVGYWALVEFSKVIPTPDEFSASCEWWDVHNVPNLILDHNDIIVTALLSLRRELNDYPIGRDLLPAKFTMPELQRVYETILGKSLDRRNFQKKMLALDILERLKEIKRGGAHKAPYLYRFDPKKYDRAMKEGLRIGL